MWHALALIWLSAVGLAQAPAAWASRSFPAGVPQGAVQSLGRLVICRDGGVLHAFSSCTREWHSVAISNAATVRLTNDWVLVQDNGAWLAFAAARGQFAPLLVSNQAALLNPGGQNNDALLLVQDGAQLHAFSGLVGAWVTRPISPLAAFAVHRNVALLHDGTSLHAMDANSGAWHAFAGSVQSPVLSVQGSAALAVEAGTVHAFSATQRAWSSALLPANTTLDRGDDWALWHSSQEVLAYSGPQGRFAWAPIGAMHLLAQQDSFVLLETPLGIVPFSAVRGSFGPPLGSAQSVLTAAGAVAVAIAGGIATAYSPLWNAIAIAPTHSSAAQCAGQVAALRDGSDSGWLAFSATTANWHAAPSDAALTTPLLASVGAWFSRPAGPCAFSAQTGAFLTLASPSAVPLANPSSAILAAYDAQALHALDVRTDGWRTVALAASTTPPMVQIWRTTLQAVAGNTAYGFGAQSGTWATIHLPEGFATGRANSESGQLITSARVLAYSALGELTSWPQFPMFRRILAIGACANLQLPLGSTDLALLAIGWPTAPQFLPGLGELLLQPSTAAVVPMLPPVGEPMATVTLQVPPLHEAIGLRLVAQALPLRAARAPYLSESLELHLW